MKLADKSYTMILSFSITAIILLCFRYRDAISSLCNKSRVSPETVEMKLEMKPV